MIRFRKIVLLAGILLAISPIPPAQAKNPDITAANAEILRDGTLVVTGNEGNKIVVAEYTPQGKPKDSFGDDGVAVVDNPGSATAAAVAVNDEGKVLVTGNADKAIVTARFTNSGRPDSSFGKNGVTSIPADGTSAVGIGVTRSGQTYVAAGGGKSLRLVRYLDNGDLDAGYGDDGVASVTFKEATTAAALALRADGRTLIVGNVGSDLMMAQFQNNGKLDPVFGEDGTQEAKTEAPIRAGELMALDTAGRIIIAITADKKFAVSRYGNHGDLDKTFGTEGTTVVNAPGAGEASGLALVGSSIFVAGEISGKPAVARLTASGQLDSSYADDGIATIDWGAGSNIVAILLDSAGRAYLTGNSKNTVDITRFTETGKADDGYGFI